MDTAPSANELCQYPDDDEVVGEIDLYLTRPPDLHDLHILQYPLRHSKIGVGSDRRITGINIRPQHGRVEVKLAVLPDDPATAGDEFGCNRPSARSFDNSQPTADEKAIGHTQSLRSGPRLSAPDCNYAIGAIFMPDPAATTPLKKPCFILSPVHSLSQLRPTFDYIDSRDLSMMRQRVETKILRANARGENLGTHDGPDDDVAPLQLNFRRRESERAAEKRRNSHATLREREEEEPWIELEFFPVTSEEGKQRRDALFGSSTSNLTSVNEGHSFKGKTKYTDLFDSHTKGAKLDVVAKSSLQAGSASSRMLKLMATNAAVAQVILYARIAPFKEIMRLVGERPFKEVITAIRMVALCMRGCWVAKKGAKDLRRQVSANERYNACRILILNLFRQHRVIKTKWAEDVIGDRLLISEGTIISILNEVAEVKRCVGWELKVEDDDEFVAVHSVLCRAQADEWDKRIVAAREVIAKNCLKSKRRHTMV